MSMPVYSDVQPGYGIVQPGYGGMQPGYGGWMESDPKVQKILESLRQAQKEVTGLQDQLMAQQVSTPVHNSSEPIPLIRLDWDAQGEKDQASSMMESIGDLATELNTLRVHCEAMEVICNEKKREVDELLVNNKMVLSGQCYGIMLFDPSLLLSPSRRLLTRTLMWFAVSVTHSVLRCVLFNTILCSTLSW